jgi:hypothetical protein
MLSKGEIFEKQHGC